MNLINYFKLIYLLVIISIVQASDYDRRPAEFIFGDEHYKLNLKFVSDDIFSSYPTKVWTVESASGKWPNYTYREFPFVSFSEF